MDTNVITSTAGQHAASTVPGGPAALWQARTRSNDMAIRARFAWRGIAEAVVLILVLLAADRLFGSGHRFLGVEPHPFGLAVLLVAAQYGTAEAAATTLIASAALLAFNLPQQAFDQDHYQWLQGVVGDPLLWLTTSLIVGEITGRTRQRAREATHRALRRESELETMLQANTGLTDRVTRLETRIAGQQRTVSSIYEAARTLGPDRGAVLRGALALIRAATGATRCSIYLLQGNTLARTGGDGWDGADHMTEIGADTRFFAAVIGEQRCLLANDAEGRECLDRLGIMAAPMMTPEGVVLGALVVEAIPFTQLHLGTVASFRSVCEWVGAALEQAAAYETAQSGRFLVDGSSLVAARHGERLLSVMSATARRIGFDLVMLQLDLDDAINGAALGDARRTVVTVMEAVLRDNDLLLEGNENGRRLCVLMPGTPLTNVPLVVERLRRAIAGQDMALLHSLGFSWLSLHQETQPALAS